jgi:uncharacterized membrane protein YtjA (UPF0391 family)
LPVVGVRYLALSKRERPMLHYALVFFVIALIAAFLGFNGVAGLSTQFGWLFAVIAVILLAVGLLNGRTPRVSPWSHGARTRR